MTKYLDVNATYDRLAPRFPALDSTRAVGALAVMTTHTAFWAGAYTSHGIWGSVLARLDVGVPIFFVLSGFLLSRTWFARYDAGMPSPATGWYLWKRVLRIYPVYLLTLVLALTLIHQPTPVGWSRWLTNLSLIDIYVHPSLPAGLTQMWSLATEVAFYLVLPLLMAALLGRGRKVEAGGATGLPTARIAVGLSAIVVLNLVWDLRLSFHLIHVGGSNVVVWLPSLAMWFAVGIGLAAAHVRLTDGSAPSAPLQLLRTVGSAPGACYATAAGLLLCAATPLAGPTMLASPTAGQTATKHVLYAAIGGLIILPGVFAPRGSSYARVFGHRSFRHLGLISYSIFCLHLPVLHFVMLATGYRLFEGHGWQIFGLTLVLTLGVSEAAYRCVELPAQRFRGRGRRSRVAAHPPA